MTTVELLASLRHLDVKLTLDGDMLRFSAPRGVMTPDMRAALLERKAEVIQFLRQSQERAGAAGGPISPAPRNPDPSIRQDSAGRGNEVLPLSYAQEDIWRHLRQRPPGAAINKLMAVRLAGPLDVCALGQSLAALAQRHELLRTTFQLVEEQPVQVIMPALPTDIRLLDLTDRAAPEREAELQRFARAALSAPFDLARGPLLRALLLRLDVQQHALLITIHPLVWDGWSRGVLVRDLAALYSACRAGQPAPLPPLPIQYADYAVWQRRWLEGPALQRLRSYWVARLDGAPPSPELPYDHPRPAARRFHGAYDQRDIDADLHAATAALSRQEGVTLHTTLLAAFLLLLYSYSGQNDIVIGLPVPNRSRRETLDLIGPFVNTLALRADLSGDPSFRALLRHTHSVSAESYAHQELPQGLLAGHGQQPLFQVMFDLVDSPLPELEVAGMSISYLLTDTPAVDLDLWLSLEQSPRGLQAAMIYDADLFEQATIARFVEHYQIMLAAVIADPDRRISSISTV